VHNMASAPDVSDFLPYHHYHHHQERTPRLEHCCLHKFAPSISFLRSMPGRVEAIVTRLQMGFNCASPAVQVCADVPSVFSIPWRVVDDEMNGSAMIHFRTSPCYMNKQAKPSRTDRLGQWWTTIDQRPPPWLTLPLSLSRSLLHTKRQAAKHIRSSGEAVNTYIDLLERQML